MQNKKMEQRFKSFFQLCAVVHLPAASAALGEIGTHIRCKFVFKDVARFFVFPGGSNWVVSMVPLIFIVHCPSENRFSKTQRPSENRVIRQKMGFE